MNVAYWVVMPAFNEARHIGGAVAGVRALGHAVLVVDDGSSDETAARAREAGAEVLVQPQNGGKGRALQDGFAWIGEEQDGCRAVITMDADGQHDPGDLAGFIGCFEDSGAQVVIGNRMSDTGSMPPIRRWTNRVMSRMLSRIMHQQVPDTQNGYRLYAREVLPDVGARSRGFAAESEVLLHLAEKGYTIASVPVATVYGDETSKINPVKDTWRFFRMLLKYWWYRKR